MKNYLFSLIILLLAFPYPGTSQDSLANELQYEVDLIFPPLSISKEKLNKAHSLMDLNLHYKSSWVKEFILVEVSTSYKGRIRKAVSKNDVLTQEQKDIMNRVDPGTDILVLVQYIPDNNLTYNDVKDIQYSFKVNPDYEAKFPGGQQKLKQYLKEKAIDHIPEGSFKNYDLTAVKFTIDEEGEIINAHVFESGYQTYKNEKVDGLLLEAICNMPSWKPAEYADGTKVKQEFVLTVGNMASCVIPLLGIRKFPGE